MTESELFYKRLPKHDMDLVDLLLKDELFISIPTDWHIIVVDVENSTQAVKNGLHHDVNLIATGSVVAVLNRLKSLETKVKIPYFFGGDGATFIVPPNVLHELLKVLENFRHHARQNMYLSLKVGSLSLQEVYKKGFTVKIARLTINPFLNIPIILGNGLKAAERIIKSFFIDETKQLEEIIQVDLEGMQCRWQEIESPNEVDKIICLLVNCPEETKQNLVYREVLIPINKIFGNYEERHPISTEKLKLDLSLKKMRNEMYARRGKRDIFYLIKNWLITILGSVYFANFKEGKAYLQKVHELSYTLMVDGMLNMVLSGNDAEISQLMDVLDRLEDQNDIIYGIHVTHSSIMSCYVEDRKTRHIHFIDGTEGGFTTAAKMLKSKLGV